MKRKMLSGKDLIKLGYPEGKAVGLAINTVLKHFRRSGKDEIYAMLTAVLANPKEFTQDSIWSKVALALVPTEKKSMAHELLKNRIDYELLQKIDGQKHQEGREIKASHGWNDTAQPR